MKIEIARSYSEKLNIGNFQSADFFCSQKQECEEKDAESVSKKLFHFCRMMVRADISEYLKAHPEIRYKEAINKNITSLTQVIYLTA